MIEIKIMNKLEKLLIKATPNPRKAKYPPNVVTQAGILKLAIIYPASNPHNIPKINSKITDNNVLIFNTDIKTPPIVQIKHANEPTLISILSLTLIQNVIPTTRIKT